MKLVRILVVTAIMSALASAADTYKVTLATAAKVGATELKPGDYKVTLDGNKLVFASGKTVVAETPVTVETVNTKYLDTRISTVNADLQGIAFGGTKTKVTVKK